MGERIVVVGASLAGLRAAEAIRAAGWAGELHLVGDEDHLPYDRPPLSKQVLTGWIDADAEHLRLPRLGDLGDVRWHLGDGAVGLDRDRREVVLASGARLGFDRLLVTTGVRNRPWPHPDQAALDGVIGLRTAGDAAWLRAALDAAPKRVLVVGGGFTGAEVASVCRGRGLDVTLVERGEAPLVGALGAALGEVTTAMHREHGVDLRCHTTVEALEGADGRLRAAMLSDGSTVEAEVAVIAQGSVRNTEWLAGSGLLADERGVTTDAGGRAFGVNGLVTDDVFAAGDVARFPHPLFDFHFLSFEHWANAVLGGEVVGRNMVCRAADRRAHLAVPLVWSMQFGVGIKVAGVPPLADEVVITQGSTDARSFAAAYGRDGTIVGAVTFDHARWISRYRNLIAERAAVPAPVGEAADHPVAVPAAFPHPSATSHASGVVVSGHSPTELDATPVGR